VTTPTGQFPNHLLERFKKVYELKTVIPVLMLQTAILPGLLCPCLMDLSITFYADISFIGMASSINFFGSVIL